LAVDSRHFEPHRSLVKLGLSISRRVARRLAAVDAYEFPSSVGQRVRLKHPDLQMEDTALVETALRQWFRVLARRPSARLSMPSMLVDDMWHEFLCTPVITRLSVTQRSGSSFITSPSPR
jgi:hypothetical protein